MPQEIATIEYSVCEDCLQYIEYACEIGHDPVIDAAIEREVGGKDANFVTGLPRSEDEDEEEDLTGYEEFSNHSCELCGSGLAGSRYGATLVIREDKP